MIHMQKGAGLVVLALGIWLLATPSGAADSGSSGMTLTDAQFKELVNRAATAVDEGLTDAQKGKKSEKADQLRKARGAAIMLAAYAQATQTDANAAERVALRDTALKMAGLIEKDNVAGARKLLAEIKSGVKPNPSADKKPIKFMEKDRYVKIDEIMKQFSSKPGGSQLEAKLLANYLSTKKFDKAKELPAKVLNDDYALMAYQNWIIAGIIKDHEPPRKQGKGKNEWKAFSDEMSKESEELFKLATGKDKDGKAAWKTLTKLDQSCYGCHKIWREEG
jgi:hypothetical protein